MTIGNGAILYDASGNPLGVAQGAALAGAQSGAVLAGSDYTAAPKAQLVKTDAAGTLYVTQTGPGGNALLVYTAQTPPATTGQYGSLVMLRQDSPVSQYVPMTADMNGNVYCHLRSKPTLRAIARGVTTAQGKYLFALTNTSAQSMVLRLYEVRVYVTPAGTGGSLLGTQGSAYYPMFLEIYRVSASSVSVGTTGTAVPIVSCDTADTVASGTAAVSSPTVSASVASLFRSDAVLSNAVGSNFYERRDLNNEKSLIIRPGEGMALICLSNGTVASATGSTVVNAPVDVTFVWSQAAA